MSRIEIRTDKKKKMTKGVAIASGVAATLVATGLSFMFVNSEKRDIKGRLAGKKDTQKSKKG